MSHRDTIALALGGPGANPDDAFSVLTCSLELLADEAVQLQEALESEDGYLQASGLAGRLQALSSLCGEMAVQWSKPRPQDPIADLERITRNGGRADA